MKSNFCAKHHRENFECQDLRSVHVRSPEGEKREGKGSPQSQQRINNKMMLYYLIRIMSAMLVMNRHHVRSHLPGSFFVQRRPETKQPTITAASSGPVLFPDFLSI